MIVSQNSENNSAERKAHRLNLLRSSLKLSAADFAQIAGLTAQSIYNWEWANGKNGLTEKGAAKIVTAFNAKFDQLHLTTDWLLFGIGERPSTLHVDNIQRDNPEHFSTANKGIKKEVNYFLNAYQNSVSFTLNDNDMSPVYRKGDIVCGINYSEIAEEDIFKDTHCIIYTNKGVFVRKVIKISDNTILYSAYNNPNTVDEAQFFSIATIIRHLSLLPNNG